MRRTASFCRAFGAQGFLAALGMTRLAPQNDPGGAKLRSYTVMAGAGSA